MTDTKELVERAHGRSRFCRDRGEVKSPQIIDQLADALLSVTEERDRYRKVVEALGRVDQHPADLISMARAALSGEG